MGTISKRILNVKTQNNKGYCLICGMYDKLSVDHVPPQGAVTVTKIEQKHVTEMIGLPQNSLKGVASTNGSKFRTICYTCNSQRLGLCDNEISKVNSKLIQKITSYFSKNNQIYEWVSTDINAITYARALIGHMLSATTSKECENPQVESPYFTPLQKFVLGDDTAIDNTHDIYYWFYPRERHVSAKLVSFSNNGTTALVSLLAYYPIAFLITEKNKGIYPAHAYKYELNMNKLILNLSASNLDYIDFPFIPLNGNKMYMLNDAQAIMSYPIKKA
ncbi:metal-binding protein [Proteus mirabilis]|nr:metal-binding protein [Proteus mirabilis]HEK2745602.1 metal-binding protein [Proteus mirabilis]